MTDEWIDDGSYSAQTVLDLRDFAFLLLEEVDRLSLEGLKLEKLMDNT